MIGVLIWGVTTGIQESTMRAYVADLLPSCQRATGYGCFALVVGAGTMLGGAIAGWLYGMAGATAIIPFTLAIEALATVMYVRILKKR